MLASRLEDDKRKQIEDLAARITELAAELEAESLLLAQNPGDQEVGRGVNFVDKVCKKVGCRLQRS